MFINISLNKTYELLMVVSIKITICRDVTPWSFVSVLPNYHITWYQTSEDSNLDISEWYSERLKSLHIYVQSHCVQSYPHKWDDVLQYGLSFTGTEDSQLWQRQTAKISYFFPFSECEMSVTIRQVLLGPTYTDLNATWKQVSCSTYEYFS